jgi:hypothetical protein
MVDLKSQMRKSCRGYVESESLFSNKTKKKSGTAVPQYLHIKNSFARKFKLGWRSDLGAVSDDPIPLRHSAGFSPDFPWGQAEFSKNIRGSYINPLEDVLCSLLFWAFIAGFENFWAQNDENLRFSWMSLNHFLFF